MEESKKQYLLLMSEIIAKQAVILGPDMAILKARGVESWVVVPSSSLEGGFSAKASNNGIHYGSLGGIKVFAVDSDIRQLYPRTAGSLTSIRDFSNKFWNFVRFADFFYAIYIHIIPRVKILHHPFVFCFKVKNESFYIH